MRSPTEASPQSKKPGPSSRPGHGWPSPACCWALGSDPLSRDRSSRPWPWSADCPFPLAELPRTMGKWQAIDDSEVQLDPEVMRFAGASEHIMRDLFTRSPASWPRSVLYGLGTAVYSHTPDICYPTAGYKLVKGPIDRSIEVPGVSEPCALPMGDLHEAGGRHHRSEEVYHTFLHHGDWLPDGADAGSCSGITRGSSRSRSRTPPPA